MADQIDHPASLYDAARLGKPSKAKAWRRLITYGAAVISVLLMGGAVGWLVAGELSKRERQRLLDQLYVDTLIHAHELYGPDNGIGFTFPPDAFERFASVVDQNLNLALRRPGPDNETFDFLGGRMLPLMGDAAAFIAVAQGDERLSIVITGVDGEQSLDFLADRTEEPTILVRPRDHSLILVIGPLDHNLTDDLVAAIVE
ncbi:MAG: hypothetical protein ACFB6S_07110 [Geminicoccaceae bacterium]